MPDYALMNQCLYEGKAKEVGQMTQDALAEGRPVDDISIVVLKVVHRQGDEVRRMMVRLPFN